MQTHVVGCFSETATHSTLELATNSILVTSNIEQRKTQHLLGRQENDVFEPHCSFFPVTYLLQNDRKAQTKRLLPLWFHENCVKR